MRYQNQNVAVLGAGLSGTAAALLLKSEGANVTVLDSADEKRLLKSTIDNLRAQGINVVAGSQADQDSGNYEFVVLSPGIDPDSPHDCGSPVPTWPVPNATGRRRRTPPCS